MAGPADALRARRGRPGLRARRERTAGATGRSVGPVGHGDHGTCGDGKQYGQRATKRVAVRYPRAHDHGHPRADGDRDARAIADATPHRDGHAPPADSRSTDSGPAYTDCRAAHRRAGAPTTDGDQLHGATRRDSARADAAGWADGRIAGARSGYDRAIGWLGGRVG